MIENVEGSMPPPTEAEIQAVEAALGVKLNKQYLEFIRKYNGGRPDNNVFDVPDNSSDIREIIPLEKLPYEHSLFVDRTGPYIIPITYDSFGNSVCMDMSGSNDGSIFFLDHEIPGPEALTFLAPTLSVFLATVRPDDTEVSSEGHVIRVWIHPDLQKIIDEQKKK